MTVLQYFSVTRNVVLIVVLFHPTVSKKLEWIPANEIDLDTETPSGWHTLRNEHLFVARAETGSGMAVGTYSPELRQLLAGDTKGKEVKIGKSQVKILNIPKGSLSWTPAGRRPDKDIDNLVIFDERDIPNYLVVGGASADDRENLFICRALHSQGHLLIGYYQFSAPNHCYIANGGVEREYKQFEMLVVNAYGILTGLEV